MRRIIPRLDLAGAGAHFIDDAGIGVGRPPAGPGPFMVAVLGEVVAPAGARDGQFGRCRPDAWEPAGIVSVQVVEDRRRRVRPRLPELPQRVSLVPAALGVPLR